MPAPSLQADVNLAGELRALLETAAICPVKQTGWIAVTGEDRVRWLNGMVTNSVQALAPGEGCYSFVLSPQGRIQGDATIFAEPDRLLLETDRAHLPALTALLDRFIIMDDVELTDISDGSAGLLLAGPRAPELLREIGLPGAAELPELARRSSPGDSGEVAVVHAFSPLVPRFELWGSPDVLARTRSSLTGRGAELGSPEGVEALRLLEGTPRFGVDIRDRELPQETGQTRALHFSKGCYIGQEIVERIRSRGNVHRTFTSFRLFGELPASGTVLEIAGKVVGELTSVAALPRSTRATEPVQVGLGYIRREAIEAGQTIAYAGGTATPVGAGDGSRQAPPASH